MLIILQSIIIQCSDIIYVRELKCQNDECSLLVFIIIYKTYGTVLSLN